MTGAFKAVFFDGKSSKPKRLALLPAVPGLRLGNKGRLLPWHLVQAEEESPGRIRLDLPDDAYAIIEGETAAAWLAAGWPSGQAWYRKPRLKKMALGAFAGAILLMVLVFGFGVGLDPLLDAVVKRLPAGIEENLGEKARQLLVDNQSQGSARQARLLARLASKLPGFDRNKPYRVILVESAVVNAFALPDGHIVIYRGLLNRMESQAELMAVLGHEAGHVIRRHSMRRIVHSSLLAIGATLLFGDASGASAILIESGRSVTELKFSRKDELDSDIVGFETLKSLNMETAAAARALEGLFSYHKEIGLKIPEFLSTHPDDGKRVERLKALAGAEPGGKAQLLTPEEWRILKKRDRPD